MLVCLLAFAADRRAATAADTDGDSADITQLRVTRSGEGVYLSAIARFELPAAVEDALLKGIPMVFVAEFDLMRERWYWTDKRVLGGARHMRLSYVPLTRRWRLHTAPGAASQHGLGVALSQNFDTLSDALSAVKRLSRWKVADAIDLEADARYYINFVFRLDVSQLPRPFQIGALGQSDWLVAARTSQRLVIESEK